MELGREGCCGAVRLALRGAAPPPCCSRVAQPRLYFVVGHCKVEHLDWPAGWTVEGQWKGTMIVGCVPAVQQASGCSIQSGLCKEQRQNNLVQCASDELQRQGTA